MVFLRSVSAFAAATLLSMASAQTPTTASSSSVVISIGQPSETVKVDQMKDVGCFNTSAPLEDHGEYIGRSRGNCQLVCAWLNKPVMAMSEGTHCWCGDLIPEVDSKVPDNKCNTPCKGINTEDCGGPGKLMVALTGTTDNEIENYVPPVPSSSTKAPAAQTTEVEETIRETATATPPPPPPSSKGPNKTSIAVGVVVGVVVLLGVIGGVFFFLRHKRRREVEEEFRRQANINSFTAGGKLHTSNSSMTDSRLDPEFMNRRASNGSIADNEDYSRRILKVTNA